MRCAASTGYKYNMNVYAGREENNCGGTVGERVVFVVPATIQDQDVTLAFDRYFTSAFLMDSMPFSAATTCIKNEKFMPIFR